MHLEFHGLAQNMLATCATGEVKKLSGLRIQQCIDKSNNDRSSEAVQMPIEAFRRRSSQVNIRTVQAVLIHLATATLKLVAP